MPCPCGLAYLTQIFDRELLLLYQPFTAVTVGESYGPTNPAYRLAPQELLTLFRGLHVVVSREEGRIGDTTCGVRNEALLIAQKA